MYLRELYRRVGIQDYPITTKKHLLEEIQPIGVLWIDSWRIRRKLKVVGDYIIKTLEGNGEGLQLSKQKKQLDAILEEQEGLSNENLILEERNGKLRRVAEDLEVTIVKLKERVRNKATEINQEHISESIDFICVPGLRGDYGGFQDTCGDNGRHNGEILRHRGYKFILIRVNGVIIGHIKLKGEKTFLSYVNACNEHGDEMLKKAGIYSFSGYEEITGNIKVEDDGNKYVCDLKSARFNYLRISRLKDREQIIDQHRLALEKMPEVSISMELD